MLLRRLLLQLLRLYLTRWLCLIPALRRMDRILRLTAHVPTVLDISTRTGRVIRIDWILLCRLTSGIPIVRVILLARVVTWIARIVSGIARIVSGVARIVTGIVRVVAGIARIVGLVTGIVTVVVTGIVTGVVTRVVARVARIAGRMTRVTVAGILRLIPRIVGRVTRLLMMLRRNGWRSRWTRYSDTLRRWRGCSRNRGLPRGSRQRGCIPWLNGLLHDGTHHFAQPTSQPADFYLRLEGHYFSFLSRRWMSIYVLSLCQAWPVFLSNYVIFHDSVSFPGEGRTVWV